MVKVISHSLITWFIKYFYYIYIKNKIDFICHQLKMIQNMAKISTVLQITTDNLELLAILFHRPFICIFTSRCILFNLQINDV